MDRHAHGFHTLQKISLSLMAVLVLLTFVGANLHALLWQSSEWLVSTVLPAVVVELTNEERSGAAAPLQRNATLDEAARLKAEDMAKHEYFSHFSPDGVSPWHWFDQAGYVYAHAGENLAIHFTDSAEVVDAWMDSPTHRANIVNGLYTEIGVGTAKGEYDGYRTVYVVQLFGTPAVPPAPVSPPVTEVTAVVPEAAPLTEAVTEEPAVLAEETTEIAEPSLVTPEIETVPAPVAEIPAVEEPVVVAEAQPEPTPIEEPVISIQEDVVVVESPVIATSSGLAVAQITTPHEEHAGATVASIATQPNALLQGVYVTLGTLVLLLLSISIVLGARRLQFTQVAYGFALLGVMGGLWYAHSLLTTGAVIV